MLVKPKKSGLGLEMRTFEGESGKSYLVFWTRDGAFHVFLEVDATEAARDCGARDEGNTRQMWQRIWNES